MPLILFWFCSCFCVSIYALHTLTVKQFELQLYKYPVFVRPAVTTDSGFMLLLLVLLN